MRRAAENGVQEQKIQAVHITSKIRISSEAGNEALAVALHNLEGFVGQPFPVLFPDVAARQDLVGPA